MFASTNRKRLVFDLKSSMTDTKMLGFSVFSPLDIILQHIYAFGFFSSRYWKIRDLRSATGKSEIVTSSHHLKVHNLSTINFFFIFFLHCGEYLESFHLIPKRLKYCRKLKPKGGGHKKNPCPSVLRFLACPSQG